MAASKEAIAAQYENYSIYVMLSNRGAAHGFHLGIFIPTASPYGHVWHATNREGGWKLEHKQSDTVPFSMSLILSRKIGSINASTWQACCDTLSGVSASGSPSPNTGEEFNCVTWVKDAIYALQNNGIIVLKETVAAMESQLVARANGHKGKVEQGTSIAKVENTDC
ncbi:hypothetical protein ACJ73_09272 [Blastomyces percursus]|uniref:Uncharacterized protein n=1 Tax=Blastomyces percursus TaxID=1658174 RepID=A0A1J9QCP9_9EURO|nr:hypothetical protein ACJ73_09272 [Blastomyces percursus]